MDDFDYVVVFQFGEGVVDGFDCQVEVVGDVLMVYWQWDCCGWFFEYDQLVVLVEQKGCDFFVC